MDDIVNIAMSGPVFLALAIIFLALAIQDFWKLEDKLTPARKAWVRIAMMFSAVSIVLYVLQIIMNISGR